MAAVKKTDGRRLPHATLEHIRRLAVERVRQGERPSDVIQSFGFHRTSIYKWLRAARRSDSPALRSRPCTGRPRTLTPKEERQVRSWICGKDPRQYGFDFGLWTRQIVREMIRDHFGVELGITTVGRLLARLEITPQKPLRRAYERDPEAIDRWIKVDYPRLKRYAKAKRGTIFFLDEAGVRSDDPPGRTWGKRGETPIVATSGQRQKVNAISAVTARGEFWYAVYGGIFNAQRFIGFLRDFMYGRRGPVLLVVDGHPSHRAKSVANYVQSLDGRLELHFLPPYAPDLNADEFVWKHIKRDGLSKRPLRRGESLRERIVHDLQRLAIRPWMVQALFRAPSVAYILD